MKLLAHLASVTAYVSASEELSKRDGVLQRIDPRFKLIGFAALTIGVAFSRQLTAIAAIFALAAGLGVASQLGVGRLARLVWAPTLVFTGLVALPAVFTEGLRGAAFLVSRAETAATLSALVALTTPWTHILKALGALRVPAIVIALFSTAYRYLFLFLDTAASMAEARRSRTVGVLDPPVRRRIVASTAGVLVSKTFHMSRDVHMAMLSRGYRGEPVLFDEFRSRVADWVWLGGFLVVAATTIVFG